MNTLESVTRSTQRHCTYYQERIAEHTPPRSVSDERMIRLYQRLLIRDRSFLHNLELLKLKEALHINSPQTAEHLRANDPEPAAALDLEELRNLLMENADPYACAAD